MSTVNASAFPIIADVLTSEFSVHIPLSSITCDGDDRSLVLLLLSCSAVDDELFGLSSTPEQLMMMIIFQSCQMIATSTSVK